MILNRLGEPERCPSCKVTLDNRNYDLNRRGENETCSPRPFCQRINHHLVLPLLLLPVILLLLGIARLIARPEHGDLLYKSSVEALNGQHNLEEFEDRDMISGIKTSFVPLLTNTLPLNVLPLSHRRRRRRRQIMDVIYGLHDKGNMSAYDTLEWAAVKPPFKDKGEATNVGQEQGDEGDHEFDTNIDEEEAHVEKKPDFLTEGSRDDWENFWYGKNDEESIRKAQAQMMLTLMNSSVDPCEDFYEYACGRWVEAHPIPRNRAGSDTFEILRSNIDAVVRHLLENDSDGEEKLEKVDEGDSANGRSKLSDIMSAREGTSHEEAGPVLPIKSQSKTPPTVPSARHLKMKLNNEKALLLETTTERIASARRFEKNEVAHDPLLILSDLYKTATSSEEVKGLGNEEFLSLEEDILSSVKLNGTLMETEQTPNVNANTKAVKERVKKSARLLMVEGISDVPMHSHESQLSNKGAMQPPILDIPNSNKRPPLPPVSSPKGEIYSLNGDLVEVDRTVVKTSDLFPQLKKNDSVDSGLQEEYFSPGKSEKNSVRGVIGEANTSVGERKSGATDSQNRAVVSFSKGANRVRVRLTSTSFRVVDVAQEKNNSSNPQASSENNHRIGKSDQEKFVEVIRSTTKMKRQSRPHDAIKKARHFYQSCMNLDVIQKRSEKPLVKLLEELGGGWPEQNKIPSAFEWVSLAAKLRLFNNNIFIAEWIGPDIRNSSEYVVQLDEAGLGLPTRDYFLSSSNTEAVKAYRQFIITIANLLGATAKDAETLAEQLVNFEIHLALITATHEEKKNLSELYHKMTVDELCEAVPGIDWRQYLGAILESTHPDFDMSTLNSTSVVVFGLRYFKDLVGLIEKYPPRTVQSYMMWRFASHRAGNLDSRFLAAKAQLRRTLTGREEEPPRWETCVAHTTAALGHAVGSLFVKRYFDEQSKSDTLRMTTEIRSSFRQSLLDPIGATATWMDVDTRSLAVDKADAMSLRVGYPDSILDPDLLDLRYADLKIDPELYFENTLAILKYLTWREHSFLGKEVDKTQWSASPTEVNAFYSRNKNQILLPAGILQPPFYHRHFPRSLNYGGVGVVIGHEMTHGFDIRGRLFDRNGNLQRWWQPPAIEAFQKRAMCLVDQYSQYFVKEVSMQIDGIRTQGENIADNGGIKQAYKAYEDWLERHDDGNADGIEESLPGLDASPRQLFFLNFAQVWCGALRPEALRNKLKTSIHSIGKFRVIGALSNSEDFASVFSCPPGSPMNPQVKCSVW